MANPKHVEIVKKGGEALERLCNQGRSDPMDWIDLRDADLSGIELYGETLSCADLSRANLDGAVFDRAVFSSCHFNGANLSGALLHHTMFLNCSMSGVNLSQVRARFAHLYRVNLSNADLSHGDLVASVFNYCDATQSDFSSARVDQMVFADINLRGARLESCVHDGPSVIGNRTLTRSGLLPLAFLRGCGLSDVFIEYLPSLLQSSPLQFYSCFISYSTANQDFADRLHADLQDKGVRCWFAPHDMQPGRKIHDQIDEAIRVYDRLLLILSEESMSSPWVKVEINKARKRERQQNRSVLFPIRLAPFSDVRSWEQFNADLGEDIAQEIREYHIPDFSAWKTDHDSYAKALNALLKALKSADTTAAGSA